MMTLADETLGFLSNCMIISTLTLGISIPLALHEITYLNLESPSLGGETIAWYENWWDPTAMHAVHIVELIFLSFSIWKCTCGIGHALVLYSTLSIYLPDTESKLRFLVLRRDSLLVAFESAIHALLGFLCALPLSAGEGRFGATEKIGLLWLTRVFAAHFVLRSEILSARLNYPRCPHFWLQLSLFD